MELFVVDTGSIGIVVSRKFVNPALKFTTEPFELEYSSSGNAYKGYYAWTTVCFSSTRDPAALSAVTATTVNMRVRVVEQSRAGSDGLWLTEDSGARMLGVGGHQEISQNLRGVRRSLKVSGGLSRRRRF